MVGLAKPLQVFCFSVTWLNPTQAVDIKTTKKLAVVQGVIRIFEVTGFLRGARLKNYFMKPEIYIK